MEPWNNFTPLVYYDDGIYGKEAQNSHQRIYPQLRFKTKWGYSEMCGFVQATMAIEIVQNNTLLLRSHREKRRKSVSGRI